MTALIVVAGILTGAFVGGCLAMAAAFAVVSRSQERMQRKVRYWQAETTRVRAGAQTIAEATAQAYAQTTAQASSQLADQDPAPDQPAPPVPDRPAQARLEPWIW